MQAKFSRESACRLASKSCLKKQKYLAFTELGSRAQSWNISGSRCQNTCEIQREKSFCKSILFYRMRWHPQVSQVSWHNLKLGKPYSESSERLCLECWPQFVANDWKVQTTINFWPKTFFSVFDSAEYAWLKWIIPIQVDFQRVSEELLCFAGPYFLLFPRLLRKLCQVSFSSLSRLVNHFLSCRLSSPINKFSSTNLITRSNT